MSPKKILLVEDDYLDVTNVKRALNKLAVDYTLHVAHNGVDALAALNGNTQDGTRIHPDIILLDINMPKMNGLEFLGIIKNYYSLNNIKTFIMTTSSEEYDKVAAENLGIAGYILKPLDFSGNRKDDSGQATEVLRSVLMAP
jgi:CheY-like chemotaxis protein